MNISPPRVVAIATPLVFAPLAGAITAFAAKHAPGVDLDAGQLQAIFITGATIAVAKSGLWMKGWQDFEKRQEMLPADALEPANAATSMAADGEPDIDQAFDDDVESGLSDDAQLASVVSVDPLDEEGDEHDDELMDEFDGAGADHADAMPAGRM